MITIRVSETGFVSGQAFEIIGYVGDKDTRILHTIFNLEYILNEWNIDPAEVGEAVKLRYRIFSPELKRYISVDLDEEFNAVIPAEFMSKSGKLFFQFIISKEYDTVEQYILKSTKFYLIIESSLEDDYADIPLKADAGFFTSVETIDDRNSIPIDQLADGKVVRVNSGEDGKPHYYTYDAIAKEWKDESFGKTPMTWSYLGEDTDVQIRFEDLTKDEFGNLTEVNPKTVYFVSDEDNQIYRIYKGSILFAEYSNP